MSSRAESITSEISFAPRKMSRADSMEASWRVVTHPGEKKNADEDAGLMLRLIKRACSVEMYPYAAQAYKSAGNAVCATRDAGEGLRQKVNSWDTPIDGALFDTAVSGLKSTVAEMNGVATMIRDRLNTSPILNQPIISGESLKNTRRETLRLCEVVKNATINCFQSTCGNSRKISDAAAVMPVFISRNGGRTSETVMYVARRQPQPSSGYLMSGWNQLKLAIGSLF